MNTTTDTLASRVPADEARLVEQLIDAALAKGYAVSVFDGECTAIRRSHDRASILAAMGQTEAETLRFHDAELGYLGWVWLIWGNGMDLFSDWTSVPLIAELVVPLSENY